MGAPRRGRWRPGRSQAPEGVARPSGIRGLGAPAGGHHAPSVYLPGRGAGHPRHLPRLRVPRRRHHRGATTWQPRRDGYRVGGHPRLLPGLPTGRTPAAHLRRARWAWGQSGPPGGPGGPPGRPSGCTATGLGVGLAQGLLVHQAQLLQGALLQFGLDDRVVLQVVEQPGRLHLVRVAAQLGHGVVPALQAQREQLLVRPDLLDAVGGRLRLELHPVAVHAVQVVRADRQPPLAGPGGGVVGGHLAPHGDGLPDPLLQQPRLEAGAPGEGELGVVDDRLPAQAGQLGGLGDGPPGLLRADHALHHVGQRHLDEAGAPTGWSCLGRLRCGHVHGGDVAGVEGARLDAGASAVALRLVVAERALERRALRRSLLKRRETVEKRRIRLDSEQRSRASGTVRGTRTESQARSAPAGGNAW